jgi:hypothetical protein
MPPKNPVRAARQAGRQAVRAAKDTRKQNVQATKAATKVAKIEARTAKRVGRISGTPASTAKPATKSAAPVTKTSTASPAKTAPKTGLTGKDLLTYGVKPKTPVAKGPSYAPFKTPADQKKSQQMTADAKRRKAQADARQQEANKKKAAADEAARKKKAAADAKRKKEAAEKKKQQAAADAAAAEEQGKKDMYLQPGETRENTLPYPFTKAAKDKAALEEAQAKLRGTMQKWKDWSDEVGSRKSNPDYTRPEPATFGPKYKKGGSTKKSKKSMYNKRK